MTMAHLLLIDAPGGNDFTVLEDAVRMGHEVTFFTSDLSHYRSQGPITEAALALAYEVVEVSPFSYAALEASVLERHERKPFDAILCLVDIRLVEASQLAERLGLRFLKPETARVMRDKVAVRERLAMAGVQQPRFARAEHPDVLSGFVEGIGYPVVVKPADGYGSQNVTLLRDAADLRALSDIHLKQRDVPLDYGLGVVANNRFSVEQYIEGTLIGCDVFSDGQSRTLLGINEKLMFPPPSFAIKGSCFPSDHFDTQIISAYTFAALDAVDFDFGAAHIEMIVAADGLYLVEINPRLVSAQIPFQMAYALERSVYADLINLHLGLPIAEMAPFMRQWFSAIRWITATTTGIMDDLILPEAEDPHICRIALFKDIGDIVRPPVANGDRIGYVIAIGKTQQEAEQRADLYIANTRLRLRDAV